ncbi:Hypothetical predicted protein [Octopus vulgaris]|uniref:Uncharacterized protein n=1 Tax=Octopus vulgaris TaxID=6645 RepID=A0AA36F5W9_OCTVU|nr:Hypothetical predicted protein [Octopus vulgaris]
MILVTVVGSKSSICEFEIYGNEDGGRCNAEGGISKSRSLDIYRKKSDFEPWFPAEEAAMTKLLARSLLSSIRREMVNRPEFSDEKNGIWIVPRRL